MNSHQRPDQRLRLDLALVERGACESRHKAQALILAGLVYVDERRVDKPGTLVRTSSSFEIKATERYVSRGGNKLEGALRELALSPAERTCVDVGASTGGFTDCLLQHGARKVYAVDVGHGLLAHPLATDGRVVVMDRTNARHLTAAHFDEPVDWVVVDASFIGMRQLAPALGEVLPPGGTLLCMIKPQFEVGREQARRNRGVIKDPEVRASAIASARASVEAAGFRTLTGCDSPITGPKGNLEYFLHAVRE